MAEHLGERLSAYLDGELDGEALAVATGCIALMSPASDFPVPPSGTTAFFALTTSRVFQGSGPTESLGAGHQRLDLRP